MDYSSNPSKTLKSLAKERGLGIDSMIESNDLILLSIVSCILSAIISVIICKFLADRRNRDVDELYNRIEGCENGLKGYGSYTKRAEKAERMQLAMVEVAQIMKDDKIVDKKQALIGLGLKYPDIAMDLVKKGGII